MKITALFARMPACLAASVLFAQPSVYVTGFNTNDVSVIQTATNTLRTTIQVGDSPRGMATSADGNRLFVGNANNNTVSIIQTAANRQIDVMPVFSNPLAARV